MRTVSITKLGGWMLAVSCGLGFSGSFLPQAHAAHIGCGDVLGPGGTFTLDSDVGPCATDPALTVDSAELNLNGFTVSCDTTATDGIEVIGDHAVVRNGTVTGCHDGVDVEGTGNHRITSVLSIGNGDDGFDVESDNNKVQSCEAIVNDQDGFDIEGTNNRVTSSEAIVNGEEGFLDNAGNNTFISNGAFANGSDGFDLDPDFGGGGSTLNDNVAEFNGENGFSVEAPNNVLLENKARFNVEDGFKLDEDGADNNLLRANRAEDNGDDGVHIDDGSEDNRIFKTKASGNGDFDLKDDNVDCDANNWQNNTGTRNQACIN